MAKSKRRKSSKPKKLKKSKTIKPAAKKVKPPAKKPAPKPVKKPAKKPRPRKPKVHKPVFEKRPRAKGPPPEFTVSPSATTQDEAYATIKARLEEAKANLPEGVEGRIIIHAYVDGSVDGELYVKVPEGTTSGDTYFELSDAFGKLTVGNRYWLSTGARYIIEKDEEVYRRFRGMNQVQTNYQRANQANIAEEGLILRHGILPGMHKRYKREAHSVFLRLHWNPQDEQPKR